MPLYITVEMVGVHRRHPRIVHMTEPMPYPVFIIDPHMAHLHRQEIFQRGLPYILLIHVLAYLEGVGPVVAVLHDIHAWLPHLAEVELQIMITQEISPVGGL